MVRFLYWRLSAWRDRRRRHRYDDTGPSDWQRAMSALRRR